MTKGRSKSILDLAFLVIAIFLLAHYFQEKTVLGNFRETLLYRFYDLIILLLFISSAYSIGSLGISFNRNKVPLDNYHIILSLGLGFTALYFISLILAMLHWVFWLSIAALIVIPVVIGHRHLFSVFVYCHEKYQQQKIINLSGLLIFFFLSIYLLLALSPPHAIDPTTYHLSIPQEYIADHGIPPDSRNLFSIFPSAMSILYMDLMLLGSDYLPKLLSYFFLILIIFSLRTFLGKISGNEVARYTVLLFLSQWIVQHAVIRANIDFHFSFYGLLVFLLIIHAWISPPKTNDQTRWATITGIFFGTTISSKVTALNVVAAAEVLFFYLIYKKSISWKQWFIFNLSAFLVFSPTLLRNILFLDDPVIYYIKNLVGIDSEIPLETLERYRAMGDIRDLFLLRLNLETFTLTPFFMYFNGYFPSTNFDGYISPFYLLTLPFALFVSKVNQALKPALLLILVYYIMWLKTAALTRYLMPILPIIDFVTVSTLFQYPKTINNGIWKFILLVFAITSLSSLLVKQRYFIGNSLSTFLGAVKRDIFLQKTASSTSVALNEYLDSIEKEDQKKTAVFMIFESKTYYLKRTSMNDPFYTNIAMLIKLKANGKDPIEWLKTEGFGYVIFDPFRIPWMRNESNDNDLINPYPEGIAKLDEYIQFFNEELEPEMEFLKQVGRNRIYKLPE